MKTSSMLAVLVVALAATQASLALTLVSPTGERDLQRQYLLEAYGDDYDPDALTTLTWGSADALQTRTMKASEAVEIYLDHLQATGLGSCAGPEHDDGAVPDSMYGTICFHEQGWKSSFGNGGAGAVCPRIVPLGESTYGGMLGEDAAAIVNQGSSDLTLMGFAQTEVSLHGLNEAGTRRATSFLVHFEPGAEGAPKEYAYGGAAPNPGAGFEFFYVDWLWLDTELSELTSSTVTTFTDTFWQDLYIHCRVDEASGGKVWNDSIVTPAAWKVGAQPPAATA